MAWLSNVVTSSLLTPWACCLLNSGACYSVILVRNCHCNASRGLDMIVEYKVIIVGLDNAGKTTILYQL